MSAFAWISYYLPTTRRKALREALEQVHTAAGYQAYDPFAGGRGTPPGLKHLARFFISPKLDGGYLRLIGQPDPELLPALAESLGLPILQAWVTQEDSGVQLMGGEDWGAFLEDGRTLTELIAVREIAAIAPATDPHSLVEMARQQGLKAGDAQKLAEKLTRGLGKTLSAEEAQQQSKAAQIAQEQFSWAWPQAQKLAAQMDCLKLPSPAWRDPSYPDLAAAYQLARRLELEPEMALSASDNLILDKVAYPLDYTLAYYAR
jgi:hypothetical protein